MQTNNKKDTALYVANIALRLLVICAFIAALVASVNFITKDRISLNQKKATAEALSGIYSTAGMVFSVEPDGTYAVKDENGATVGTCDAEDVELTENIDALYTIRKAGGEVYGYCAEASPMGFKDEVGLIVAAEPDGSLREVQIISLKETKGIGDKVMDKAYLAGFARQKSGFTTDSAVLKGYLIAGATRTSKPVTLAVDEALCQIKALIDTKGGGSK